MTLAELFGDDPLPLSREERHFLEHARDLWAHQLNGIIKEAKMPKIKTRIVVRRKRG